MARENCPAKFQVLLSRHIAVPDIFAGREDARQRCSAFVGHRGHQFQLQSREFVCAMEKKNEKTNTAAKEQDDLTANSGSALRAFLRRSDPAARSGPGVFPNHGISRLWLKRSMRKERALNFRERGSRNEPRVTTSPPTARTCNALEVFFGGSSSAESV
jgi:hypothetical protein